MDYLNAELRGVCAYKGLDYVDDYGALVACNLCGTGNMWKRQRHEHFHGQKHARKYHQLREAQEAARIKAAQRKAREDAALATMARVEEARVIQAACPARIPRWEQVVKAHLYSYITTGDGTELLTANRAVDRFKQRERITLLELAVLRAEISRMFPGGVAEMREQPALDPDFNPSEYVSQLRVSTDVNTVVERVFAFVQ